MSKEKDLVHLDEVFKTLRQGEEPYRAGSWQKMKEILDKEMPQESKGRKPGPFLFWGSSLLVLLLVGGLVFWGSDLFNKDQNSTKAEKASFALTPSLTEDASTATSNPELNPTTNANSTPLNQSTTQNSSALQHKMADKTSSNLVQKEDENQLNQTSQTVKQPIAAQPSNVSNADEKGNVKDLAKKRPVNPSNSLVFKTMEKMDRTQLLPIPVNSQIAAQNLTFPKDIVTVQKDLAPVSTEKVIDQLYPENENKFSGSTNNHTHEAEQLNIAGNRFHKIEQDQLPTNQPIYQADNGGLYKALRDTFTRLEIVKRESTPDDNRVRNKVAKDFVPVISEDTTAIYKVARLTMKPLPVGELEPFLIAHPKVSSQYVMAKRGTVAPAASYAADPVLGTEVATNNFVSLDQYKVQSKKVKTKGFAHLFQSVGNGFESVFNGNRPWYLNLSFGANSNGTDAGLYGGQIGLGLAYQFAERWSLATGLKYKISYVSNGYPIEDQSISYDLTQVPSETGSLFSGTQYQTDVIYSVDHVSRLNIPLVISYNLGRVSLFTGAEMAYYFPVGHNKGPAQNSETLINQEVVQHENPFKDKSFDIDQKSFSGRFALGYSAGVQYDFSRKWSLDIKWSQMLWDNFGKYKNNQLKHLYRQPNVELNLNFYLGRKEKVIYMMNQHKN